MISKIRSSKNQFTVIGVLLSFSLLVPPNVGFGFIGINFEDIPLILITCYLLFGFINVKKFKHLDNFDLYFLVFFLIFIIYTTSISNQENLLINKTNLRFYLYFIFSYLLISKKEFNLKSLIEFFQPLCLVMFVNFLIIITQFETSYPLIGWISNNTSSTNIFSSGRLGGLQGSGPNVIGVISAICAIVYLNLFLEYIEKNKRKSYLISFFIFIISSFNLFFTYSRGSYLALILGIIILVFYTPVIRKPIKLIFFSGISLFLIFTFFFNSSVLLKQSNRTFLNDIAIDNVNFIQGTGGGNYVREVYKEYLITLDEEILLNELNIEYTNEETKNLKKNYIVDTEKSAKGYFKLKFDYYDDLLPRSIVSFFYSNDGKKWNQLGFDHTNGDLINLIQNNSYFEVGGWGDGQSIDQSYLEGFVEEVYINIDGNSKKYLLNEENRDKTYFIYLPIGKDFYDNRNDGKIIYTEDGINLKRPRSYWIGISNNIDLTKKDFEITVKLNISKLPRYAQTIFSQSSILEIDNKINNQSWKWVLIDGRMYFYWIETIDNGYSKYLGGKSLRSGKLISKDEQFNTLNVPSLDVSQFDELTTAHNGFLTMAVEYGAAMSLFFLIVIIYSIFRNLSKENLFPISVFLILFIQNFTNDLIYSPDVSIYFWLIPLFLIKRKITD